MKIQAAVVREKSKFTIEPVTLDEPQDDEVLVRVVATGMCHTDLTMLDQQFPFPLPAVLGHEGAGVVEQVGRNVSKVKAGDHVILTFGSCGICKSCNAGIPAYCGAFVQYNVSTRRPDGSCPIHSGGQPLASSFFYQSSFATHAIAHFRNVVKVDRDLPLEVLAPLGCGVQTGAGAVLNCLKVRRGTSIVVFGIGAVGLSAVIAARIAGCSTIIAVDMHESRLALAKELGATHAMNARDPKAMEEIISVTATGADYAVEATGVPAVVSQAIMSLAPTGSAVLLGVMPHGAILELPAFAFGPGKSVRASIEGDSVPDEFIPRLAELYRTRELPLERMIAFYDLADINAAAADSHSGKTIKPVIRMPVESLDQRGIQP
jgi:aryl-alcohol dehydrogenase